MVWASQHSSVTDVALDSWFRGRHHWHVHVCWSLQPARSGRLGTDVEDCRHVTLTENVGPKWMQFPVHGHHIATRDVSPSSTYKHWSLFTTLQSRRIFCSDLRYAFVRVNKTNSRSGMAWQMHDVSESCCHSLPDIRTQLSLLLWKFKAWSLDMCGFWQNFSELEEH